MKELLIVKAFFRKKSRDSGEKNRAAGEEEFILVGKNASFAVTEAYKTLRTNVMFSLPAEENRGRLIGVTSVSKGEGKSTNTINLALSIAELGKKVLFLDCDLRLSAMGERLNLPASPGLSNALVGLAGYEDIVHPYEDTGLDVILAGEFPPNPSEILESPKMAEFCRSMAERYDYVIIDLPPVGVVSDAMIVSRYIDGVIMVVRQEHCAGRDLRDAVRQLNFINAKILGFIFCDHTEKRGGRYGKYGKYGKYGSYGEYGGYGS